MAGRRDEKAWQHLRRLRSVRPRPARVNARGRAFGRAGAPSGCSSMVAQMLGQQQTRRPRHSNSSRAIRLREGGDWATREMARE